MNIFLVNFISHPSLLLDNVLRHKNQGVYNKNTKANDQENIDNMICYGSLYLTLKLHGSEKPKEKVRISKNERYA